MVVAVAFAVDVAVAGVVPRFAQMLELEQHVEREVRVYIQMHRLVLLHSDFAGLLVGDAASKLAFVFASRGYDELLLLQAHKQGNERPCIDGSDLARIVNSHSEVPNIFGLYIRRCASKVASYQHSVV